MYPTCCLDTSHSLLPYTYTHAVFWHPSPMPHVHAPFSHSPPQTQPFNPLQPLSKYFPLGAPGCLLLPPIVYCLLLQPLSMEIRRGGPYPESSWISSPQAVEVAAIIIRVVSLPFTGKAFWRGQPAPLRWAWHLPQRKTTGSHCFSGKGETTWTLKLILWAQPFKKTVTPSSWGSWKRKLQECERSHEGVFPTPGLLWVFKAAQPIGLDNWWLVEITVHLALCLIRNAVLWVSFLYFLFWWHSGFCVIHPSLRANLECISWVNIHIKINPNLAICDHD